MSLIAIMLNPGLLSIVTGLLGTVLAVLAPVLSLAGSTLSTVLGLISVNVL